MMATRIFYTFVVLLAAVLPAHAQLTVPGQDWDGALSITTDTTIDLAAAVGGDWDVLPTDPSWSAGDGVYDPSQWAVVFHYTSVTVDANATLSVANQPSGAPVVGLVTGTVNIAGEVDLDHRTLSS